MKEIIFTKHAIQRLEERKTNIEEVKQAIQTSKWQKAEKERLTCALSFSFKNMHFDKYYCSKEVVPIFVEEKNRIVVITVYTYFSQKEV